MKKKAVCPGCGCEFEIASGRVSNVGIYDDILNAMREHNEGGKSWLPPVRRSANGFSDGAGKERTSTW
jgi:hypothetical protein